MAEKKPYAGAISSAMLQGLSTGAWVAAGGLPPWRRRAVRAGVVAAGAAVAAVQYRRSRPQEPRLLETPVLVKEVLAREVTPPAEQAAPGMPPRATLVAFAVSTGLALGGRRLAKRWLARLVSDGYARPHRSLGIRMGMLTTAVMLVPELVAVADDRRAESGG